MSSGSDAKKSVNFQTVVVHHAHTTLAAALRALDEILTIAVDRQARLLGPASLLDPWRGMHLEQADIRRLLDSASNAELFGSGDPTVSDWLAAALRTSPRIESIARKLRLSNIDLAILLIVLAPDLDLRYERIYGYLQDDIARKRPTQDLIANLLAQGPGERLAVCARFGERAPLLAFDLLVTHDLMDAPPLAHAWLVDELWRRWLLGDTDIGSYIGGMARLFMPPPLGLDQIPLEEPMRQRVRRAIDAKTGQALRLRLLMHGPHGSGKFALAQAIGFELKQRLLVIDLRDCGQVAELRTLTQRIQRGAMLSGALLYFHGFSQFEHRDPQLLRVLFEALGHSPCGFILSCATRLPQLHAGVLPVMRVELAYPSPDVRLQAWRQALAAYDLQVEETSIEHIATRFALSAAQIQQAVAETHVSAVTSKTGEIGYDDLACAVRMQCGTELSRMATHIVPRAAFESLVVPEEVQAQLREICMRVATRDTVGREWAGGSVHARSVGVTALFVGPSGTGKTLSAEALAHELGLHLYCIDLSGVVSKYIGETEKNLDRVFAAAEHANAVLFFDEADALFGKRSEVKDAHDRYANIEVAYLLQKMERFDGLAILATNLRQNLDESFARRLTFTVNFPFPEEPERRRLWEQLWPPRAPRHADVDLTWFAHEFKLSGGNIRNTVLAAAHLAAADGKIITHQHLLHATRREFQKLGKNLVQPATGERRAG
ncbi:MAG TPA: AAA family ATPase [Micropepsaceae bacterium]